MKYLGVDYGIKRIGLAGSDSGVLVTPLEIVPANRDNPLDPFDHIVKKYNPEEIVFGLPVNEDGSQGKQAVVTATIINQVKQAFPNIKIESVNEFLTSAEAQERSKRKVGEPIDDVAAAIILEQYFSEKQRQA